MVSERNPLIRAKRRAGRVKRWVKRKVYERNIGREYQAWLVQAPTVLPGTTTHDFTISVLVPVYNTPIDFLRECLGSVLAQQAANWQLLVADDGSTDAEVLAFLAQFAQEHADDPRIVVTRKENGGISSALNVALAAATGEYIGMLDHDDALDPRCIEITSAMIEAHDHPDAVYSDEDKISPRGEHFELYCKPSFSPELLLTQMYLCHFTAFRREQVVGVGGLRTEMDGAQDFDLALRLLPQLQRVVHVPHPLYHWRAWSGSTALTIDAKPWAQQAAARAQQEHLDRTFGGGTVAPSHIQGLNEVHPRLMTAPRVSVIIPTIGTANDAGSGRFVDDAVRSLAAREQQTALDFVIVTTGVIPEVPAFDLGRHTITHVPYLAERFNFSEAINTGRAAAQGEYLVLLNDDTTVAEDDPVTRMLELGQISEVGITGARLTYPDSRIQHVGMVLLPSGPTHAWIGRPGRETGYFGSTLTPRNYSAVTAAAMLVRTSVFDLVGGFDAAFARDYNDVDFCLRVGAQGFRVAWTPYAHFVHYEGATMTRRKADAREHALFTQRWEPVLQHDPFYSSSLNPELLRIYEAL
ncbi:MAG: glycosyltransferase [Candidatus Nanopelagicales bacterium]|nr:glycosyltransferase [Candidatus Nanopelagicales bacterium]